MIMEGNILLINCCKYVQIVGSKSNIPFLTTCMLEAKGLAANLWAEAMNVAADIQNIVPHSSVKGNTPFKDYFGHKLDVSNFKVFGSTAWALIPHDKRKDLQPQSVEYLFIGYLEEYKGFKL